ncbi:MAG: carbohydrate binding domain-containing protein, partial [Bacteroidales bacterium]|nr:carbohydrate binding domain-containing protein [Bacteroidales bacterium]
MKTKLIILASVLLMSAGMACHAQTNTFDINMKKLGAPIQPTMYGIFFEDINFAADGGLYAELIKNRSFEFPVDPLQGWTAFGNVKVREDGPFDKNPHYVRLGNAGHAHKHTGLENNGFFGIGLKEGAQYRFSVWARVPDGGDAAIRVELIDRANMGERQAYVQQRVNISSSQWKKYEVVLTSPVTDPKATLRIFLQSKEATVDLEHISLFPVDTWMGHENGMRKDLAQA